MISILEHLQHVLRLERILDRSPQGKDRSAAHFRRKENAVLRRRRLKAIASASRKRNRGTG